MALSGFSNRTKAKSRSGLHWPSNNQGRKGASRVSVWISRACSTPRTFSSARRDRSARPAKHCPRRGKPGHGDLVKPLRRTASLGCRPGSWTAQHGRMRASRPGRMERVVRQCQWAMSSFFVWNPNYDGTASLRRNHLHHCLIARRIRTKLEDIGAKQPS